MADLHWLHYLDDSAKANKDPYVTAFYQILLFTYDI